jgi:phosphate transport system substrate-binding protein
MKKYLFLFIPVIMLLGSCGADKGKKDDIKAGENDTVSLSGTIKVAGVHILDPLMTKWAGEFMKANPKVNIGVQGTTTKSAIAKLQEGTADLILISRPLTKEEAAKGLWAAPVAIDAIVPVISFDNDFIQPLTMYGITKENLSAVFKGKIKSWGALTKRKASDQIKVFVQTDSSDAAECWNAFIGAKPEEAKGTRQVADAAIIKSLRETKEGIGYVSIMSLFNQKTGVRTEGIYILPVDFNNNGLVDDNEQFYDNFSLLSNALSMGKMPVPPAREFYIVTKTKPKDVHILEFVKWMLTIGQNYMPQSGYINIQKEKANAAIETLK